MANIGNKTQRLLANSAPNLIYAFIPTSEINSEVFGKYASTIMQKREDQRTFITAAARAEWNTNSEKYYAFLEEIYKEVYGKSSQEIIYYLAQYGAMPAAKYEKESIGKLQCIGALSNSDLNYNFNQAFDTNQNINFNPSTGRLELNNKQIGSTLNYDQYGNRYMNYYGGGYNFTALNQGGKWNMYGASNGETTYNLVTGNKTDPNKGQFWNNLNNALPAIQGLLATVLSILQATLVPYRMSPNQIGDGWVQPYGTTSHNVNTWLVVGGIAAAAVLLSKDK